MEKEIGTVITKEVIGIEIVVDHAPEIKTDVGEGAVVAVEINQDDTEVVTGVVIVIEVVDPLRSR